MIFSYLPQIGFLGVKTAPENWGTNYPYNYFTYNSFTFHNGTTWKNFPTMRDK